MGENSSPGNGRSPTLQLHLVPASLHRLGGWRHPGRLRSPSGRGRN